MNIPIDLNWLEAVLLAGVRLAAFIVVAPPFSYSAFPGQVKAMVAVALGIAVSPAVVPGYHQLDTGPFLFALVMQLLIGFALGFLVLVVFAVIQSAGNLIDLFGGFQVAQAYDPQLNLNGAQFTKLFQLAALALLFSSGAYQLILAGLAKTFTVIPLAAQPNMAVNTHSMITAVTTMFVSAVQIAGPLIIVLFLADVGLGLLTKIAPALNAFAMGYPIKILITLLLGGVMFVALPNIVAALTGDAVQAIAGFR
ncbi:MAG: type III secretion protein [Microbacteriaceae bacterium]|nr:MAG: type III secretion protein [Microbacteriaceae bacterium]